MTADVTGPARDELELPAAVLHLLDIGRAQLAEVRAAAEAERERTAREDAERFAAAFAPVREAVLAVVPDTLVQYVDWSEAEDGVRNGGGAIRVTLAVPGCSRIAAALDPADGGWRVTGFAVPNCPTWVPGIAVAVALAREAYLERQAEEESVPF